MMIRIIFLFIYQCQTRPVALRNQHRLQVSENKGLREVFGSRKDDIETVSVYGLV
jgi:hypothetical protein